MNYLQGGDSFQLVKQGEHAIQTLRTDQSFSLLWADLNLKLKSPDIPPRVFLYHADGHHHPMGDHLSSSRGWGIIPPFAPTDWSWFEPWGKTLSENNYWYLYPNPPAPDISFQNGIITLTNHGNADCGIYTGPTQALLPFLKEGKHLTIQFNNPLVTQDSSSSQLYIELIFRHPGPVFFAIYLAIGLGGQFQHLKPQWTGIVAGRYYGAYYTGPGQHIQDLYALFVKFRTELDQSTDPTDWELITIAFALATNSPSCVDYLKNDFLGFYFPTNPGDPPPTPATGWQGPNRLYRVRFPMTPYAMTPSEYYALLLRCGAYYSSQAPEWQYDKGDSTYPYGIRIFSPDGGYTWNEHFNDDHIFALFGTPPAPPPPPEPPIDHWTILDIQQIRTSTGYIIIATTNVPCHLYMFWTNIEPEKHPRTRISRGLTVPDATDYCFVVWHENEQEEPGDTIYHTFIKEPWPACETRWFTFRALVNNEWSPSVGPIFKKHRAVQPPFIEPYTIVELLPSLVFTDQYTIDPNPPDYTQVFTDPYTWS